MTLRAVRLERPGRAEVVSLSAPAPPGPDEATVRVLRVGVCGTDLHAYAGRQPMVAYPVVPGHELAVTVEALGDDARTGGVAVGDLCTVLPYVNCGDCAACRTGRTNACVRLRVLGVHVDGGLVERMNVPLRLLVPAGGLGPDAAALVEMLAIGEHAAARGRVAPEDRVLVVGLGPIGLGAALAALRRGARLGLVDTSAERRDFAASRGLGAPVDAAGGADPEGRVREAFGGELATVVVDATGSVASMVASPRLLGPGGRLVLVGHTPHQLPFENQVLHQRELTVLASRNATRADFDAVMADMARNGPTALDWVTHRVALQDVPSSLEAWSERPAGLIKALVDAA